jgi:hypothetical protein
MNLRCIMRTVLLHVHTLPCVDCGDVLSHQHTEELLGLGKILLSQIPNHLLRSEGTIQLQIIE